MATFDRATFGDQSPPSYDFLAAHKDLPAYSDTCTPSSSTSSKASTESVTRLTRSADDDDQERVNGRGIWGSGSKDTPSTSLWAKLPSAMPSLLSGSSSRFAERNEAQGGRNVWGAASHEHGERNMQGLELWRGRLQADVTSREISLAGGRRY